MQPPRILRRAVIALAVLATTLGSATARAQGIGTIDGTVLDAGSRRPIQSAQVTIAGALAGAMTNAAGEYRIVGVSPGSKQLTARRIGYAPVNATVEVVAGQTARQDFQLQQAVIELGTIVTVGTGGAQGLAKAQGNTVATISPPPNIPITSISEMLQGREPGIQMLPSSGLTGEGARIRIRGNASLSQSNEPVVYVDGVRVDNGGGFGSGYVSTGGGGQPSRLDDIDPNSVEKVEILKGAAAATLYGTEASNGVIIVTTKKGSAGSPRWTLNAEQAASQYPKGRVENNWGFARSDSQAARLSKFYGQQIQKFAPFSRPFATRLYETGNATTTSLAVSGGTPLLTYYVGGRLQREDGPFSGEAYNAPINGVVPGTRSKDIANKYQGDVNLGLSPSSFFRLNVRALYTQSHNDLPDNNNSIYAPYTLALFSKPERAECAASQDSANDPTFGIASVERCRGPGNPTGASSFATVREALQRSIGQDARHVNGVVRGTYVPNAAWNFDGTFGIDFSSQRSSSFLPFGNNLDFRTNQANEGDKNVDDRTFQVTTVGANGSYNTDLFAGMFSSQLLFGAQGFITKENDESSTNQGFPGPGIEVVSGGSTPQVFEVFSSIVNAGYFAQEQVGFRDWLFTTVGARYDYNSAFGKSSGGVLYPKASISIIPSDRPTYAASFLGRAVPVMRLRAAIGKAGRQPGAFDKLTTYAPLTSEEGGGLVPDNLGNPDLKPEISTEWEVGTELGFLDNRFAIDFTRWQRVLKDALVARQFPVTGGFRKLQLDNIGQLDAFGWDLKLKAFVVNRPNVSLDLYANTAFLSQLVKSLGGAPPLKVGGSYPRYRNFIIEGYAPGALLGAQLVRPCAGSATTTPAGGVCLRPGELPFDTNGDGRPDTEAQLLAFLANPLTNITQIDPLGADDNNDGNKLDHYLGKPTPDYQGSFGGSMRLFQNWQVATNFEYKAGRYTITDLTGAFRRSNPNNGGNTRARATAEATLLNPASTAQQRLEAAKVYVYQLRGLSPYDGLNQNFAGDFLRWRELSLTYNTPPAWAARLGTSDLAVTLAAKNFALWTKYAGVDPEVNVYGRNGGAAGTDNNFGDAIDAFGFPLQRRFSLAVRASF